MTTTLHIAFPPPLDLVESLEPFRRSGDDGIDRWDGVRLLRTSRVNGRAIAWRGEIAGNRDRPALRVRVEEPVTDAEAMALDGAIRATFVVAPPSFPGLLARDPILADLAARWPGLRPFLEPDVFTGLVRGISAQQVNLRWAATTRRRLAEAFGTAHDLSGETVYHLDPAILARVPVEAIRALQFTTSKARFIVGVAEAFATGALDGDELRRQPDDEVIRRLTALHGIGRWSAEWTLARTFGRPRVVAGDLGVRKAVATAYLGRPIASEDEVRSATAHWGPSAAVAQTLLLRTLVP